MSPAEVAWRIEQRLSLGRFRRRMGRPAPALSPPPGGFRASLARTAVGVGPDITGRPEAWRTALEAVRAGESQRVLAMAGAIEAGRLELFARTYDFGPDPRHWPWNRDPDGGPEAPDEF